MAYKSKYYDPAKAHEYYMKHRQLKGRKKTTTIANLNEEGKVAAKEVKERLQAELKAALKKVKRGNTTERNRLRELYKSKYEAELSEIYKDSAMVKQPKQKKQPKQPKQKQSANKQPRQSRQRTSGGLRVNGKRKNNKTTVQSNTTSIIDESPKTDAEKLMDLVNQLKEKLDLMTDEQKERARKLIENLIEQYKNKVLDEVNDKLANQ